VLLLVLDEETGRPVEGSTLTAGGVEALVVESTVMGGVPEVEELWVEESTVTAGSPVVGSTVTAEEADGEAAVEELMLDMAGGWIAGGC